MIAYVTTMSYNSPLVSKQSVSGDLSHCSISAMDSINALTKNQSRDTFAKHCILNKIIGMLRSLGMFLLAGKKERKDHIFSAKLLRTVGMRLHN